MIPIINMEFKMKDKNLNNFKLGIIIIAISLMIEILPESLDFVFGAWLLVIGVLIFVNSLMEGEKELCRKSIKKR